MRTWKRRLSVLVAVGVLGSAGAAWAQPQSNADLLEDFIYYVRIQSYDVAASLGQELLSRGLSPAEFVELVDGLQGEARFEDTILRAMKVPQVEPVAGAMERLVEGGRKAKARDPVEIARNIALLTGGLRARQLAREALAAAGEYAMPQLLEALRDHSNRELQSQVQRLIIDLGKQSVVPLGVALDGLEPSSQELAAGMLGAIGRRAALPFLARTRDGAMSETIRGACVRAMRTIAPGEEGQPASELFRELAEGYYEERLELTAFASDEAQLVWSFDNGLRMTAVDTRVYHETAAMRMCEASLRLQNDNERSVALWVASNLKREIESPAGYENPVYPPGGRDAMYFAIAAGPDVAQAVLARALRSAAPNAPLARKAIEAIGRTAGGGRIWTGRDEESTPLLRALRFPNRRVQYEAALALGRSSPSAPFAGSERVVPTLASMIREASMRYALVVSADEERYRGLRAIIEGKGYTVLPFARGLGDAAESIAAVPGIDLIVTSLPGESTEAIIEQIRGDHRLLAAPTVALLSPQGLVTLGPRHQRDPALALRPTGIDRAALERTIDDVVESATGGPISAGEARAYAEQALDVLRDLAVAGNPVLDVSDAAVPLIEALRDPALPSRLKVADILSRIGQPRAQVALVDAALAAAGDEQVRLLDSAAGSARRQGNMLEERQVRRLIELARSSDGDLASASVALLGALSVRYADLVPLILGGT